MKAVLIILGILAVAWLLSKLAWWLLSVILPFVLLWNLIGRFIVRALIGGLIIYILYKLFRKQLK